MPIFEFRCGACRHDFEVLVRNGESPRCPQCESDELQKLFSSPAAHTGGAKHRLPIASECDRSGPPCSPTCCRLPT